MLIVAHLNLIRLRSCPVNEVLALNSHTVTQIALTCGLKVGLLWVNWLFYFIGGSPSIQYSLSPLPPPLGWRTSNQQPHSVGHPRV